MLVQIWQIIEMALKDETCETMCLQIQWKLWDHIKWQRTYQGRNIHI